MKRDFYKVTLAFSYGTRGAEIVDLTDQDVQEYVNQRVEERSWSDKFRSCKTEPCEPPAEWLRAEIEQMERHVINLNRMIADYNQLLKDDDNE